MLLPAITHSFVFYTTLPTLACGAVAHTMPDSTTYTRRNEHSTCYCLLRHALCYLTVYDYARRCAVAAHERAATPRCGLRAHAAQATTSGQWTRVADLSPICPLAAVCLANANDTPTRRYRDACCPPTTSPTARTFSPRRYTTTRYNDAYNRRASHRLPRATYISSLDLLNTCRHHRDQYQHIITPLIRHSRNDTGGNSIPPLLVRRPSAPFRAAPYNLMDVTSYLPRYKYRQTGTTLAMTYSAERWAATYDADIPLLTALTHRALRSVPTRAINTRGMAATTRRGA